MENIVFELLIISAIISMTVIIVVFMVFTFKGKRAKLCHSHEKEMKELEFYQKKEWENLMKHNIKEDREKTLYDEFNKYKDTVDKLDKDRNNATPLDMNRIALLYLVLSSNREGIGAENLEKEMEKVKKSYDIIKNYIK